MSEELNVLKQENRQYANLLQTANEEKQILITSLRLLANELRTSDLHAILLRCFILPEC